MSGLLYRWPAAAEFGARVPKEKFYERGTVPASVREKFVTEIRRITWAYKLAESTVNLPGSDAVPEIQVFQIEAKGADVSDPVLTAIDKAISFPIVFEITRRHGEAEQIRMVAAYKQPGTGTPKLSANCSTGWLPHDTDRRPLPTAISMAALYTALLRPLTQVAVLPGEDMSVIADRLQKAHVLEREITALERKLRTEPQLNRKIELRRTLKTKQAELDSLR
ncbi:DUF4391 domain-containing protein [Rhodococcus sp. WS3]|uniref:DUF4391 domain-containing protein n=1 Tax=Rhodococcus sp. WS3 TaxID=2486271 RepID=UPI001142EB5B|nr:DUF4391 domain-containing protein [Rhodococcus sp. WS3]ROZ50636.1 DUF4391 domain-containing protein [Rhodococcus sp. WS3]